MDTFSRYAIYFAPEAGSPLANFGAHWLGWDAQSGKATAPYPNIEGVAQPVCDLSASPRKYGFHGTLKPPFKLADGYSADMLKAALSRFAKTHTAFEVPEIKLRSLGGFLAITPDGHSYALGKLAQACVEDFDIFRAAPTEAELARRRSTSLTTAQEQYLLQWGYPYVFDEFRFHLTLTGRLKPKTLAKVKSHLAGVLAGPLAQPLPVKDVCLFGEAPSGAFHIIDRYALSA